MTLLVCNDDQRTHPEPRIVDRAESTEASHYLSALFRSGTFVGLNDGELLERFLQNRSADNGSAELAFAALVERHGAMILRVCRGVLTEPHEAEDAFQATFLVLATRAAAIRRVHSIGPWLHGVALRVAACARSAAARRQRHERRRAEMRHEAAASEDLDIDCDRDRVLHEELGRLPQRFRAALVLCYLEGLTHDKAAEQLGCPVGTIRSRLATARERLRSRLLRRGIAPALVPAGLAAPEVGVVLESAAVSIAVPSALVDATVRAAVVVGVSKITTGKALSVKAVFLMEKVLKNMALTKLTQIAITLAVVGLVTTGGGLVAYAMIGHSESVQESSKLVQSSGQETKKRPGAAQESPVRSLGPSPSVKEQMRRSSEETIRALLREYNVEKAATKKAMLDAKTVEQRKALLSSPRVNPALYAGALLYEAEANPGTPAAEDALIWVATNLFYGSMAERAKELIARDHIQSPKIEALFRPSQINMTGSVATEQLFREALAKNPDRTIRALACHYLARFLDEKASFVRSARQTS